MSIPRGLIAVVMLLGSSVFAQFPEHVAITGRVVGDNGEPLADVQVHLQQRLDTFSSHGTATSDEQGSFTLQLAKGATGVVFSNGHDADRVVDYAMVKSPAETLTLKLKTQGRKLRGTVVDEDGKPVPNALVGISANTREGMGESMPSFRLGLAGAGMLHLIADGNGTFETDKLPALPVIVWAAAPDDKKGLQNNFRMSRKKPVLDMGRGMC